MEKETFDGNDIEVTETETSEQQVSEETEKPHKWRKPLLITLGGIAGTTAAVYIGTAAYFYFHCLPNKNRSPRPAPSLCPATIAQDRTLQ